MERIIITDGYKAPPSTESFGGFAGKKKKRRRTAKVRAAQARFGRAVKFCSRRYRKRKNRKYGACLSRHMKKKGGR